MKVKLAICALVLMAGCNTTPEQVGPTLDAVYGEVLDLLTDARIAGEISDGDWANVKSIAVEADTVLDAWLDAQENGTPSSTYAAQIRGYIQTLRGYLKEEQYGQ